MRFKISSVQDSVISGITQSAQRNIDKNSHDTSLNEASLFWICCRDVFDAEIETEQNLNWIIHCELQ